MNESHTPHNDAPESVQYGVQQSLDLASPPNQGISRVVIQHSNTHMPDRAGTHEVRWKGDDRVVDSATSWRLGHYSIQLLSSYSAPNLRFCVNALWVGL